MRNCVAAVALLIACSPPAPKGDRAAFATHDSAGVQLVDNYVSVGTHWIVDSVPATDIGADDHDPYQQFTFIIGAHRLADGRVAVATDKSVLLFDSTGHFLRQVGASGEGPGEFRYVGGLTYSGQDTLMVWGESGKVSYFAADGSLLREVNLDRQRYNKLVRFGECNSAWLSDGSRIDCGPDNSIRSTATNRAENTNGEGDPGPGLLRQLDRQYLVPASLDTAYRLGIGARIEQFGVKTRGGTLFLMHPFYSRSLFAAGGSPMRIATMLNPEYRIEVWTPAGKLERVIRRADGRRAPTPAERAASTAAMLAHTRDTAATMAAISAIPAPDSLLAAGRLLVTSAGEIVVMHDGWLDGATVTHCDVFSAAGRWLGQIELPPRVQLLEAGTDYLVYVRHDGDGVPHVEVHRFTTGK